MNFDSLSVTSNQGWEPPAEEGQLAVDVLLTSEQVIVVAALAGTKPEELRSLKGKAIHIHISDCDGKVHGDLPPGRGVVDFDPYLREIAALDIPAMSIELEYSPEPDRIADWVREAYSATDRLMRSAGIPRG